jgi:hypothetical protein
VNSFPAQKIATFSQSLASHPMSLAVLFSGFASPATCAITNEMKTTEQWLLFKCARAKLPAKEQGTVGVGIPRSTE